MYVENTVGSMKAGDQACRSWTEEPSFTPTFTEETKKRPPIDSFQMNNSNQDALCPIVHAPKWPAKRLKLSPQAQGKHLKLSPPQAKGATKTNPVRAKKESSIKRGPHVVEQPPSERSASKDWSTNNLQGFLDSLDWKRVYQIDNTNDSHVAGLKTPPPPVVHKSPAVVEKSPERTPPRPVMHYSPAVVEKSPALSAQAGPEWKTDTLQDFLSTIDWNRVYQGDDASSSKCA